MNKIEEQIILHDAINKYGISAQILMMIEESSELIKAICKCERDATYKTRDDILKEMVDVQIMLDQMELIFDHDNFLKMHRHDKLIRLEEKLIS